MTTTGSNDPQPNANKQPGTPTSRRRPWWIVWSLRIFHALLAMLWTWLMVDPTVDGGMRRVLMALTGLLFVIAHTVIFAIYSPRSLKLRLGALAALFLIPAVLLTLFEPLDVTGGMIPHFRPRWRVKTVVALPEASKDIVETTPTADLATTTADDFPQFLGPDRNQMVRPVEIVTTWSDTQRPKRLWQQPIGAGWSGFVTVNGFAVTQEQRDNREATSCYRVATGELVWIHEEATRHETFLGGVGPRATPCIDEGRVYALGATGVLVCLDGRHGELLWRHDLAQEMVVTNDGAGVAWGRSGSPLIVDDLVVVPVGGPAGEGAKRVSLAAYDKATGELRWQAGDRQVSYASPIVVTLDSVRQIMFVEENQVSGFDPANGTTLWSIPWEGNSTAAANVTNAIAVGPQSIFLSKGYAQGAGAYEVKRDVGGKWTTQEVWRSRNTMKTKFSNVVHVGDTIYGLDDVTLAAVEPKTGKKLWKQGRYGYGQILLTGTTLLVQSEEGKVSAVRIGGERPELLGTFAALEGKCWNNLCMTGPLLLVRNSESAACYDLSTTEPISSSP